MDFTRAEMQCLIFQTIQQVGSPSQDVERTSHAVLVDKHFGHAMLEQLEISLQRVSENWESWRASASFSLLARRTLSLSQSPEVRARALDYVVELRSVCFKWLGRLKNRAAASTDDKQRSELHSRATEIALLCTSTYDVEDVDFDIILRQDSAISVLIQSSIIIQENHDSVQSEHQALYESLLQSHRAMMYRVFESLSTFVLKDSTGLCDAITANWASFHPTAASDWCLLEQPHHHWLAINSNTLLVHFNLLTAELLVNGLPLARLSSEFMQHEIIVPRGIGLFIVLVVVSPSYLRETKEFSSSRDLSFHNSFMVASHQITCLHPRDHLLPSSKYRHYVRVNDSWDEEDEEDEEDEDVAERYKAMMKMQEPLPRIDLNH
ncbi:hypothetical protein DM02DRAFT_665102 [Periconia macrospinosa]|uniref:Uncharacterized protein n=1 Tax=Periconia macrospinosa TaxID=97972 RepID=A0A2V1CYR8_9PLEO|nr:hypothetical protein DM02DRAFT_665102 [Periconia macrospinosa]